MRLTDRFSVTDAADNDTCTLVADGQPVLSRLEGREIEAQYAVSGERFLLCTSMGSGWDDVFTLYLINHDGRVIDAITGGGLMSAGVFHVLGHGDDTLDFTCFTDRAMRLSITRSPQLRVLSPAPWRYSRMLSRHYLSLRELPLRSQP